MAFLCHDNPAIPKTGVSGEVLQQEQGLHRARQPGAPARCMQGPGDATLFAGFGFVLRLGVLQLATVINLP